ncbi:MAG: DeoR/GlpR transcriptional regulator [Chloroflexi bacterium]|nr:DeoR/GlpR transcriptional regulator [Chloroflexota bacterium]
MNSFDRRSEIIRLIQDKQRASTRALSALFEVSEVTIRHDLKMLAAQGWLQRVHGGAEITPEFVAEQPFADRQRIHSSAKESIAAAAAAMVRPGDTILLDSSTTAFQLAQDLKKTSCELRIVTNNLHAALTLKDCPKLEVITLGGVIRGDTSSVVGTMANDMLVDMHADKGFFSASGLTIERGLTDADIREVEIKRTMVKTSRETIVMLDASKFGQQSFLTFAALRDIDHLVTEDHIPNEYQDAFASHRIQIKLTKNA